jgi:hypothetical protein
LEQEKIHAKGFDMNRNFVHSETDDPALRLYGNIKVGVKKLEDAVLELGSINKSLPLHAYTKKSVVYTALAENDLAEMRNISNFYYNVNGIYHRVVNYLAYLYRYDWYVVPELHTEKIQEAQIMKDFSRVLGFLDSSNIRL